MAKKFNAAQRLAMETDFSDAAAYEKLRNEILHSRGKDFFTDFFDAIPKSKFCEYIWLREELSYREHLNLCLEIFDDNPTAEIENEISNMLTRISPERKIRLSPPLLLKEKFWCRANLQSKLAALKQFADKFSTKDLCTKILELDSETPLEELANSLKEKLVYEKFSDVVESCAAQSQRFNAWAKIILDNDLPHEIILTHWDNLTDDNKRAAFDKYFDTLPADKIADIAKKFPPDEIFNAVKDKATFREKFPELVESCAAQSQYFNAWAKIILDNDLPHEIILTHWDNLTDDDKRAAFDKYFDTLPVDKLADMAKNLSPDEIFNAVKDKQTFTQKLPDIIERYGKKFSWAQCLLDNTATFSEINVDDDVMIFFMYEAVKRMSDLNALNWLIKLLKEKIDDSETSPRVKIVYSYICAAFSEHFARQRADAGDTVRREKYLNKRDEFIADAEKAFTEIFNGLTKKIEAQADNPDEKFFIPQHAAHVLPPCTDSYFQMCSFCEAVTWPSKNINYCPKLHRGESPGTSCFRIDPNLKLSAEYWSVIELMAKLHLIPLKEFPPEHKLNREFFTRIGGEFNRLNDLLERIKCRKCGKYMRADRDASKWLTVHNIKDLKDIEHFPVLIATFQCKTDGCSEKGKPVYISYCWHCGETIDSRDSKVQIAGKGSGYYLCNKCGAGYKDYIDPHVMNLNEIKYAIFPGTICPSCTKCPKCDGQEFKAIPDGERFKLRCTHCAHEMDIPSTIKVKDSGNVYKKGKCTVCGHELEWNRKRLDAFTAKFSPIT